VDGLQLLCRVAEFDPQAPHNHVDVARVLDLEGDGFGPGDLKKLLPAQDAAGVPSEGGQGGELARRERGLDIVDEHLMPSDVDLDRTDVEAFDPGQGRYDLDRLRKSRHLSDERDGDGFRENGDLVGRE